MPDLTVAVTTRLLGSSMRAYLTCPLRISPTTDRPESTELVDRPEEKSGVVRVCSPFTVESETPYAYIPVSHLDGDAIDDARAQQATASGVFAERVIDTLLQTGINDTVSARTIEVHEIVPWPGKPGSLVTHKARYSTAGSLEQNAALMIAAEDITVTPAMLTAAATEAPPPDSRCPDADRRRLRVRPGDHRRHADRSGPRAAGDDEPRPPDRRARS